MNDLRAQWTEEAVGANDPEKADVINRLTLVEHNIDGTHKIPATTYANNAAALAAGLVPGQLYRGTSGGDPEPVFIVFAV